MSAPDDFIDRQEPETHNYDYDLIVIGGGSGGLSCSKNAADLGKKVALFDFVKPTPIGTKWGIGGTCVNVGCIPKKLMHHTALLGESLKDSRCFGWKTPEDVEFCWTKMVSAVQEYVGSLNFGYKTELKSKHVDYHNAYAVFTDPHTVEATFGNGTKKSYTARRFVIAVGGRPKYPEIPGAQEFGITSDDIFSLQRPPGKTLCVGASYIALECGGFLVNMGYDVTVMARSILLRGFDQQCAENIGKYMSNHGVRFIRPAVPIKIERIEEDPEPDKKEEEDGEKDEAEGGSEAQNEWNDDDWEEEEKVDLPPPGRKRVTYKLDNGEIKTEEYNTVLFAIGREAETRFLALDKAGVKVNPSGKFTTVNERTNVPHIYAVGDVLEGLLELTPTAIKAGKLLAERLYANSKTTMDYLNVPTTVFTPIEYGCVGYTEEDAVQKFGADNLEVYHVNWRPLEWTVPEREETACYCKLIVNLADNQRVIGYHVLAPNAGEMTQAVALAIRLKATKFDFDGTVGIHPTNAEEMTTMTITKRSGKKPSKTGC
eukprot:TRINITY_DN475_c0_g1_i1.p1 TRINITY_DN475_c0_g1~~TRINITY_DN475_c0_g1_i1.p1  ORF type:complete len:555 (+),score=134.07 TRINITY_DN475_c0_g1_i1:42-1667(+)